MTNDLCNSGDEPYPFEETNWPIFLCQRILPFKSRAVTQRASLNSDGKIYATARSGSTFILKAADKFEVLTTNDLNEECFASPVICGHRLFLRTARTLYCVGEPD